MAESKKDLGTTTGGRPTGLAAQGLGAKHFTPLLTAPLAAHARVQAWLAGWACNAQHGSTAADRIFLVWMDDGAKQARVPLVLS